MESDEKWILAVLIVYTHAMAVMFGVVIGIELVS